MLGNWDDLRFLATVRQASFARAGRVLGVDATTVGRRVSALEKALRARLLERLPDGLRATSAGARLVALAEEVEGRLALVEREVTDSAGHVEGRVRITAGDGFAPLLVAAMGRLRSAHPALDLELVIDSRVLDLVRGEADLALRTLRPADLSLAARKLGALSYSRQRRMEREQTSGHPSFIRTPSGRGCMRCRADMRGSGKAVGCASVTVTREMRCLLAIQLFGISRKIARRKKASEPAHYEVTCS